MTTQTRKDKLIGVWLQTTITKRDTTVTVQEITFAAMHGSGIEVNLLEQTPQEGEDEHQPPSKSMKRSIPGRGATQPLVSPDHPVSIMPSIEGCIRYRLRNSACIGAACAIPRPTHFEVVNLAPFPIGG